MTAATLIAPLERLAPAVRPDLRRTYTCPECGHVLRVSGLGRHRVYFELTDERADDPVMNRVCPSCGHGLPGKNPPGPQP
jgi:transcription elongation factor Elf1